MSKTAPCLFLGLGARVLLDAFHRTAEPNFADFALIGAWQGVGLYYALMEHPTYAIPAGLAIGAKLLIEFSLLPDVVKCAITLFGIALGVMFTDVLSQFLEDGSYSSFGGNKMNRNRYDSTSTHPRAVSFPRENSKDTRYSHRDGRMRDRTRLSHSDITAPSLDSTSDWLDRTSRTPLEREVAALRARASLADTEKRRYKEERVWALASGNQARAEQMAWQVKRYRALENGFHKEADVKLLEAQIAKQAPNPSSSRPAASSSRLRQSILGRQANERTRRSGSNLESISESHAVGADGRPIRRHRKQSTGSLKPTTRTTKYG